MALKKIKPTTPGQRHKLVVTNDDITATRPEKSLVYGIRKSGGRNNQGKMTMRYIGGGHKQLYRFVDFKRTKDGIPAVVKTIEYDPNRSSRIALICYADGKDEHLIADYTLEELQNFNMGYGFKDKSGNYPYKDLVNKDQTDRKDVLKSNNLQILEVDELFNEYYVSKPDLMFIVEIKNGGEKGYMAANVL